jgi:S1-C subfamily serine protease
VIVAWNGEALEGAGPMMAKLRGHKAGDVVKVKVWREGKELELDVTLKAAKPRE